MEVIDLRNVLTRIPSLLKRRHVPPRELTIVHLHMEPGYAPALAQQALNRQLGLDRNFGVDPASLPPQLDISLDFSSTKIDHEIPHLPAHDFLPCYCCGDTKPIWQFPRVVTERCDHDVSMCRNCLASWIETSLTGVGWERISCAQCNLALNADEVRWGASEEVWKR
jgi:hypothetical protein